ncbi:hypothetical protein DRP07_00675 [Archaeoglobales archaeon]|nr:MAG: hypothetical protein DRP07_00675 [Archaeoglobales archaeon]
MISALSLIFFFLSLLSYDVKNKAAFIIPVLGSGLNFIAALGALQIEEPHVYIYNVNDTVYKYTTTELHISFEAALLFILFGLLCLIKLLKNFHDLLIRWRVEKEMKLEGW